MQVHYDVSMCNTHIIALQPLHVSIKGSLNKSLYSEYSPAAPKKDSKRVSATDMNTQFSEKVVARSNLGT